MKFATSEMPRRMKWLDIGGGISYTGGRNDTNPYITMNNAPNMSQPPSSTPYRMPFPAAPSPLAPMGGPLPLQRLTSIKGLTGWITALALILTILSTLTSLPSILHSTQVWGCTDSDLAMALSHTENQSALTNEYDEESGIYHNGRKDDRSRAEKEYDSQAQRRVVFGAADVWLDPKVLAAMDPEEREYIANYPERLSRDTSMLAYLHSFVQAGLQIVSGLLSITGAILTLVLLGIMVHNARILAKRDTADGSYKHASPGWAVGSAFIPFVNIAVPVRELWRAWRRMAESIGLRACAFLVAMWWIVYLVSGTLDQIILRKLFEGCLVSHEFSLVSNLLDILFYLLCYLLFRSIRKTVGSMTIEDVKD